MATIKEKEGMIENFYYYNSHEKQFRCIHAKRVVIPGFEDMLLYIHEMIDRSDRYTVSEGITGLLLESGSTKEIAINEARIYLVKNEYKIGDAILKQIEKTGISPSFLDMLYCGE